MAVLSKRSGVPAPTIKHYIREGLLAGPTLRTSRNMAFYDARNVERIQAIKRMQGEQFLPLRVIGEVLEPSPSAKLRADRTSQRKTLTALAPTLASPPNTRRRRSEVLKFGGVRADELVALERAGVLALRGTGANAGYEGPDVALLDLIGDIRRAGYGEVFPLSIAKSYLRVVSELVQFEVEQFRQHALSRDLPVPLTRAAREAMEFAERLIVTLRAKVLPQAMVPARTRTK